MQKLKLENIRKTYKSGETVTALRGVSVGFRECEFVSVLGPSGCGKTTLLNIIGGLDRYDSGDLIIGGVSTKMFTDSDWDAYRNRSIGFVFQNYNLISHQTVLQNVEIALTLSGVSVSERKRRAKEALDAVGLSDQLKKKPNQLSGGQMQRVAIARALVNNPDIILADEPTGALDSQTSVQVMDILKKIAEKRLVIMVTHNRELAEKYSSRIIRLLDGEIISDSNPVEQYEETEQASGNIKKHRFKKTSMSLPTAATLSFKNLMTKRGRTIITSFAGSIGIIGVALVLALSNGLSGYMEKMQSDTLSGFPITVNAVAQTIDLSRRFENGGESEYKEYPQEDVLYSYDSSASSKRHDNIFTEEYIQYVKGLESTLPGAVNNITFSYGVTVNLLAKVGEDVVKFNPKGYFTELPESSDFILSLYDLIGEGSRLPQSADEIVLVVDKYNRIDKAFFERLGIAGGTNEYKLEDFIGKTILKVVSNNDYYTKEGTLYVAASPSDYVGLYESNSGIKLTVVGILRPKKDATGSYFSTGIAYTTSLTDAVVNDAKNSDIAAAQLASDRNVLLGTPFADEKARKSALLALGADTIPTGISIYPKNYESKELIKDYLDKYNEGKADEDKMIYSDLAETITAITGTLLNTVTYVLVGFAAISLFVSTIMISIITYVSVIERTKEIGILRSVGARKIDISRVFIAETLIIGFIAGVMGVVISYLATIPINIIIARLVDISGIADLNPLHGLALILGSMTLTLLAGFIPSWIAAKKDPVVALRTE
jgi:putative ABC transport system permease protein